MKRLVFLFVIIGLIIFALSTLKQKITKDLSQPIQTTTVSPSPSPKPQTSQASANTKTKTSIFVPYWTLQNTLDTTGFDQIIYFGIKPGIDGISRTEEEEKQLLQFNDALPADTHTLLTLRMINNEENLDILKSKAAQQKIIEQTIQIANEYNMQGIVLDLEIAAIPFDSLTKSISTFSNSFYKQAQQSNLTYSVALYADTLYRARPYDIKTIAQNADAIMIMAYDLHKARGNPGPNFPLRGKEKFGYDMTAMTDDFLQFAPPKKITVIFGSFGYDWPVDQKQNATKQAQSLSYNQIKQKFLDKCEMKNCQITRDKEATETKITYTDEKNQNHTIWFEDPESIKSKQNYLKQKGINSFSHWAYSYF